MGRNGPSRLELPYLQLVWTRSGLFSPISVQNVPNGGPVAPRCPPPLPCRSLPFRSLPFRFLPCRSLPFRSLPFRSLPFRSRSLPFPAPSPPPFPAAVPPSVRPSVAVRGGVHLGVVSASSLSLFFFSWAQKTQGRSHHINV